MARTAPVTDLELVDEHPWFRWDEPQPLPDTRAVTCRLCVARHGAFKWFACREGWEAHMLAEHPDVRIV